MATPVDPSPVSPLSSESDGRWKADRTRNWRMVFGLVALISLPVSGVTTVILNLKSGRVIKQWVQPEAIQYKSFDPYCLSVMEGSIDWGNLSFPRRYQIVIAMAGAGKPDHGHMIDYSFHAAGDDVDEHIGRSSVEWGEDGVTFVEASGHRLFVPKAMFIGGR